MSHLRCPFCGGSDGRCTSSPASGRSVTECKSCGRIVEEHRCEVEEIFVERARDSPLCIVTPDFSENDRYRTPPLDDDPFESIGFITAFSTWSLELAPLFTATTFSFCGHLAELERVLLDPLYSTGTANTDVGGGSISMVDNLRAYFQIVEVSSLLGLERDVSDHAIQLFRDCSSTTYLRNRNIEALATAALVQAIREAKEPRTLQEISAAANIPQKEIHKYMKVLSDALKLSQPINSNSISVYMPRFCSILELEKPTQDLATHIGEVVMNKSFCTRRNPISISAAAIYLSCQLEDKRKTQTEICKATVLTEVTLRKVYKELLENLNDLLPANYTPAVPPEKAFPVTGSALGRVCATRATAAGGLVSSMASLPDCSATTSTSGPVLAMSSSSLRGAGVLSGGNSGMSSGATTSCGVPSLATSARGSGSSKNMPASHMRHPTFSPINSTRGTTHMVAPMVSTGPAEGGLQDRSNLSDNVKEIDPEWAKENNGERIDSDNTVFGASKLPSVKGNSFVHPFNPFQPFFPELPPGSWPPQALYGASSVRPDESLSGNRDDRSREDGLLRLGLKGSQLAGATPGLLGENAGISSPLKPFQLMGFADASVVERDRQNCQEREKERGQDEAFDRQVNASSMPVSQGVGSSIGYFKFPGTTTTNVRSPVFQGFPQGMWGFNPAGSIPPGVFPPQFLTQCGGLLQGLPQVAEGNSGIARGPAVGTTANDLSCQGRSDTCAESVSYLPTSLGTSLTSGSSSQPSVTQPPFVSWRPPFPHLYLSSSNPNTLSGDGNGEVTNTIRRSAGLADGIDAKSGLPVRYPCSGGVNLSTLPTADLLPKLSIGCNTGMQASSPVMDGAASQRSEESGKSV